MKTNNNNKPRIIIAAGIAMIFIFTSVNTFAQNTVKKDDANKTSVAPAKDVTPANASDNTDKTSVNSNNTIIQTAIVKPLVSLSQPVDKKQQTGNDTLSPQKDIKVNENIKNK